MGEKKWQALNNCLQFYSMRKKHRVRKEGGVKVFEENSFEDEANIRFFLYLF